MTTIELKLELSDRFAREAFAAGFLNPKAVQGLIKAAMERNAALEILEAGKRGGANRARPLSMKAIQAEVNAVRAARKSKDAIAK
jgi:hypothetical protein